MDILSGAAPLMVDVRRTGGSPLRSVRLPASVLVVRLLAVAETVIGVAALAKGGRLAWFLVAVSYLGFAGFVLLAMAHGEAISSCGCFGGPGTPPTLTHVLIALSASGLAVAAAVTRPPGPLLDGLRSDPLIAVPYVILIGCCVWFAYAAIAVLPRTASYRINGG